MKTVIFFFVFISISHASIFTDAERKLTVSVGQGSVSDTTIHHYSMDLQFLYPSWKDIKFGFGPRITHLYAPHIQTVDDGSETIHNINLTAFNMAFFTEYNFEEVSIGFNIDIIGFTIGKSGILNTTEKISTKDFNILLVGENDRGTLNSEFWIGTYYKAHIIRVGLAHEVIEYSGKTATEDKRRQKFFDVIFLSVSRNF